MGNHDKILITSSTKNLSTVRKFVEDNAETFGLDQSVINQIVLSVDEACTNIIKHAHKYNEANTIEVEIETENNQFKIVFNYRSGNSFDPNDATNPDMSEYFKNFRVGGLGIPIMKKFMSKIIAKHINPDINSLILIKSIEKPSAMPSGAKQFKGILYI